MRGGTRLGLIALLLQGLAGCANAPVDNGARSIAEGRVEEGLKQMEEAAKAPQRGTAYTNYIVQRNAVSAALLRDADRLRAIGDLDGAEASLHAVLRIDTANDPARSGLATVQRTRVLQGRVQDAQAALRSGDVAGAERVVKAVLAEDSTLREARALMKVIADQQSDLDAAPPKLREALQRQISLELRDAPIGSIFEIISSRGNINFVIDRDVKIDARSSVFVKDTSLDDVIRILLLTNQLERKILNGNSLLIYPATHGKQRDYQELVMRSFYLANADAKQTASMIRALVKTRDIFVDDKLNLVIMRDTPDAVRLAEQLVATQDLGEPEVMLDLEVLEVSSTLVKDFGIRFPDQIGIYGITPQNLMPDLVPLNGVRLRAFAANPLLLLNLSKQDGSTNILANPRIRVKNREKAKVHIGERVPVITTTSTANVGVSSSVSYLETGLKLDVEPNIFLENEVAIKVQLEVSNILEQLSVSGTIAYRLGTRNAATTLRLRDGETQMLAGLIDSEDRKTYNSVPLVGELPVLGRLFRNDNVNGVKTEIVLLVTPHIVRNITRPDLVRAQFASGTDAVPGATPVRIASNGGQLTLNAGTGGPAMATAAGPAPATGPDLQIAVTAPAEVKAGQEFAVVLSMPAGSTAAAATVQLTYDPSVLKPVGIAPAPDSIKAPDIAQLAVDVATQGIGGVPPPPTQVRFQSIAAASTQTEIGMLVLRSTRRVEVPGILSVSVVK
jgi:general secretion pathway protein D